MSPDVIAASSWAMSTSPLFSHWQIGDLGSLPPGRCRQLSKHTLVFRLACDDVVFLAAALEEACYTPLMLMLLLSVAPLVKMISFGSAPIRLAR